MARTAGHDEKRRRRKLSIALQGGGSHGAYTWGVLDRLLELPDLDIEAVSGTSAGAMNGAALVSGLARGGPAEAKRALAALWDAVSRAGDGVFNPWRYVDAWPGFRDVKAAWSDAMARLWSPYDNPVYVNPLEAIVRDTIDMDAVRACRNPPLYVCATDVRTNERHVFFGEKLSAAALLASACLPTAFRAVTVEDASYWDGGFTGNPALEPLIDWSDDLLIVEVNALRREAVPTRAADIANRLNEVSFNASLVQEIRMIETLNRLIARGALVDPKYRPVRFHAIEAGEALAAMGADSKSVTRRAFLDELHGLGRASAQRWIEDPRCYGAVGRASSIDVEAICEMARGTAPDRQGLQRNVATP